MLSKSRLFSRITLVAITFSLSACGNGSGGGGAAPADPSGDYETPAGTFSSQSEVTGTDPEMYGPGCKTPGKYDPNQEIDSRLKVGQVFTYAMRGITVEDKVISALFEATVTNVTATSFTKKMKILTSSGVPEFPPGYEMTTTCSKGINGVTCGEGFQALADSMQIKSCQTTDANTKMVKNQKGNFKTADHGANYLSWYQAVSGSGTFSCDGGKTKFQGNRNIGIIKTNSVPSYDANTPCGGIFTFMGEITKDASGRVMSGFRMELVGFKNP